MTPEGYYNPVTANYYYYLKDHLGNNRVTYHYSGSVPVIDQEVEYYPFGSMFAANNLQNNLYLYNGKELNNEFFENYDYGARFYDAQMGRWHAVDPLAEKYPNISPYAYVANNPIKFVDPDGREIKLANNYSGAMTNIAQIAATSLGSQVISQLINRNETYTMRSTFFSASSSYNPRNRTISYVGNPWYNQVPRDGGALTSMIAMGHESFHAFDHSSYAFDSGNAGDRRGVLEPRAVSFANYLRNAYSLDPLRNSYGSIKGNFNQFSGNGSEKISDFTTLGSNERGTSMGFSYTKTTETVLSYKKFGMFKIPDETKTEIATYYIIVSMNADKNVSFQIYNNEEDYHNATSNW